MSLDDTVYAWKGGSLGLIAFTADEWTAEVRGAALRCDREGDPITAYITPHLLQCVADVGWILGSGLRGVALVGRPGAGRKSALRITSIVSSIRLMDSGPGARLTD